MKTQTRKNVSEKMLWVLFLILITVWILIFDGCKAQPQPESERVKWDQYYECSQDQGDYGCDSCFFKVFGYHTKNPGYLDYSAE